MQGFSVPVRGTTLRGGAIVLACGLALALAFAGWQMTRTAPPPTEAAEAKAYDFLADTELTEAERRKTARDIAKLCEQGLINGC